MCLYFFFRHTEKAIYKKTSGMHVYSDQFLDIICCINSSNSVLLEWLGTYHELVCTSSMGIFLICDSYTAGFYGLGVVTCQIL